MKTNEDYNIDLEVMFNSLELIDVFELVNKSLKNWQNYSLCLVNDCVVRLGVIEGEFHWHKHDDGDEFFYVLEGELHIETKEKKSILLPGQGYNVPKGVEHKTTAPSKTVIIMVGKRTIIPTGN